MKKEENKTPKKERRLPTVNIIVYFVLRILVIISMVGQSMHGNWLNVFLCILTLILFTVPTLVSRTLNIKLPTTLEIIVYLFIYSAEILGEIQNFYGVFTHWDTMLHTLNGFLAAAVGFSLIDILNRTETVHISLTPMFVALVSFCFSMTIGVLWEFYEFAADNYFGMDMQKDTIVQKFASKKIGDVSENEKVSIDNINKTIIYSNNNETVNIIDDGYLDIGIIDTMKDLFVNFIGAFIFSILGFFYIKDRDEYKFIERFIPILRKLKEE